MIVKCPNCESGLEYSTYTRRMICKYCGSEFDLDKIEEGRVENNEPLKEEEKTIFRPKFSGDFGSDSIGDYNTLLERKKKQEEKEDARKFASTKMNILKCTSCGAELAVNSVETSTFCAYCGQATVVLDRVDDFLQPDGIIPFKIHKEDAERIIRQSFSKGAFVPNEIKNFQVDKLRGIYVPFWLFDADYSEYEVWSYTKKVGKQTVTRYAIRDGNCEFRNLSVDSSSNLNDDSSQRLEPFDFRQLVEFKPEYLSGFYSDRFDQGTEEVKGVAQHRMHTMFASETEKKIPGNTKKLKYFKPSIGKYTTKYALLPAWFLTFRYDYRRYTILVNGQTGKMVGAVPYNKKKALALYIALIIVCVIISIPIMVYGGLFVTAYGTEFDKVAAVFFIAVPVLQFLLGKSAMHRYKGLLRSIELSNSANINQYVSERQDS